MSIANNYNNRHGDIITNTSQPKGHVCDQEARSDLQHGTEPGTFDQSTNRFNQLRRFIDANGESQEEYNSESGIMEIDHDYKKWLIIVSKRNHVQICRSYS
ncbi:hypothetical protein DASC09_010390 [Saccharomycopsis crataegensis]|uniref:Uncharacterized protein n=1 Tax=Saccharomycopsis crataegensis TaxID=43959 RepID=A0AAV5QG65_9ASCO|nr:hypothetical protein DASC09_010390 [Saccharomycopsis crataegensis]